MDEGVAAIFMVFCIFCAPSYYIGKYSQRGENNDNCVINQKVEIAVGQWVSCDPKIEYRVQKKESQPVKKPKE